jgi:hypothetical protein
VADLDFFRPPVPDSARPNTASKFAAAAPSTWAVVSIFTRRTVTLAIGIYIAYLSYPVVNNILSPRQVSAKFNPCVG